MKGEADADPYIPDMVVYLKDNGYAYLDQGALVVDVKRVRCKGDTALYDPQIRRRISL